MITNLFKPWTWFGRQRAGQIDHWSDCPGCQAATGPRPCAGCGDVIDKGACDGTKIMCFDCWNKADAEPER